VKHAATTIPRSAAGASEIGGGNLEVGELLGLMAMTDQMEMAGRAMA
jgi:hypothetical protein